MKNKRFTGRKYLIVIGISLLWIIAGVLLYEFVGVDHGPKGGLDSIAAAIVYVFMWEIMIYVPPALAVLIGFFVWLYQNHRPAIKWVLAAIAVCILSVVIYSCFIRKAVSTPDHVAVQTDTYEKWQRDVMWMMDSDDWTEPDRICEYVYDMTGDVKSRVRDLYDDADEELLTSYIDAAMKAHYEELPHVTGWEYIPDITAIISDRKDAGKEGFLMGNRELLEVAEHYGKKLNRDHRDDRYEFKSSAIAQWYSWLPMSVIFYDDGTMDIVLTP